MNLVETPDRWYMWDRELCPTLDTAPFKTREVPLGLLRFDLGMGGYYAAQRGAIDRCLYAMEFGGGKG